MLWLLGCADPAPTEAGLRLRWLQAYPEEDWARARAGLEWALSLLGALPPADDAAIRVVEAAPDTVRFTLDPGALGLAPEALAALEVAVAPLRVDDEAEAFGGVDVARLLLRTVHEPHVYAAVTGVCPTFAEWSAARVGDTPLLDHAITESLLTATDRHLQLLPPTGDALDLALLAWEGTGSLLAGDFEPVEVDVIDLMPNGQQRFAVYDHGGRWLAAADPAISPAGPPSRCAWCHELGVQRGVTQPAQPEGWLDEAGFLAVVDGWETAMAEHRAATPSALDWSLREGHEWGELLVETRLYAPPARLAREWAVAEAEVEAALDAVGAARVENPEFPWLGPVVARADADRAFAALLPALDVRAGHPLEGRAAGWSPLPVRAASRDLLPGEALVELPLSGCR